jgi:hypothetical protein
LESSGIGSQQDLFVECEGSNEYLFRKYERGVFIN